MQRKPLYYIVNLIFPTAIITFIAVVGFFMPASTNGERVEKINLGITTLLAMSILLLMVSDQMPTTSDLIPLMGWFFLSIILLISAGTVMTSIVILINQQGHYGKRVPTWARRILFNCLGPCLAVTKPKDLATHLIDEKANPHARSVNSNGFSPTMNNGDGKKSSSKKSGDELHSLVMDENIEKDLSIINQLNNPVETRLQKSDDKSNAAQRSSRSNANIPEGANDDTLQKILSITEKVRDYIEGKESDDLIMLEWEYACNILDRLMLLMFSSAVAFMTFGVIIVGNLYNYEPAIA